jgi:ABC-type multidrug transport system permease subunit
MSHDFYRAVWRGLIAATVIATGALFYFMYHYGGAPVGQGVEWFTFRMLLVVITCTGIGSFYSYMLWKAKHQRARMENLGRVHPNNTMVQRWLRRNAR